MTDSAHAAAHGSSHVEAPDADDLRRWGLDPTWSRHLDVLSHDGSTHMWHLLDTGADPDGETSEPRQAGSSGEPYESVLLCVHGNPTWGVLWQKFLQHASPRQRVIAVDQLSMGWSERTDTRRYADRVRDLDDLITALGPLDAPLIIAAHDWGGAIAMGWAVHHAAPVHRLTGLVLCNTGIAVPAGRSAPSLIRFAASAPVRDLACRRTSTFVNGTWALSGRRIAPALRDALRAPYRTADRRRAIADFVADVPLTEPHPSADDLAQVADGLGDITAPVLLVWGHRDPVFNDDFAADLTARFPNAVGHRVAGVGHLAPLEADLTGVVDAFISDAVAKAPATPTGAEDATPGETGTVDAAATTAVPDAETLWAQIDAAAGDDVAFVDGDGALVRWADLATRTCAVASELRRRGLRPGDRVAMLTPPGIDLPVAVYGTWRAGGVTVVADRGLGLQGLGRALRSARPAWVLGPPAALTAARVGRWAPGATFVDITRISDDGAAGTAAPGGAPFRPQHDDPAAVLFTSGATGPAKGVRYTHGQLQAQRDALRALYGITADDRLVAAFAPFALYGPALGITTALPPIDVTKPATLTSPELRETCRRIDATMVFASPSALANVVATGRTAGGGGAAAEFAALRLVLSAGAPIAAELLRDVGELAPNAQMHTPYGMTEVLPVADIDLAGIERADAADPGGGVCVGSPVSGVEARLEPLARPHPSAQGVGEIVVRAPWVSAGYVDLWATERACRPGGGWHRTGDVGTIDGHGNLWVQGRLAHVIDAVDGQLGPVPIERIAERVTGARRSAAVGVGPAEGQVVVAVVELPAAEGPLADTDTATRVRAAVDDLLGVDIAAVLVVDRLPVDIRHNSKVDRAAVGRWAADVLAGGRPRRLVSRW